MINNTAMIIRHADREHIVPGINENEPLNEAGWANSIKLGEEFSSFDSVEIFTSPIGRCIQTGEAILQGFKKQGCISQSDMLGEPGPFVFDRKLAGKNFKEFGTKGVVENQISGLEMAGIKPLSEGCEFLKNYIVSKMNANIKENLLIFITHDAIIAPFIYQYTGEKFGKKNWIDFLDGAAFVEENKSIQLVRNGKKYEIY
jgi:hypothetical protein